MNQLIWAFLFLTVGVVYAQQPVSSSSSNGLSRVLAFGLICVTNTDGSTVTITADAETENVVGAAYNEKGNYVEAAFLFRKAAEQGDGDAQFNLGLMYAKGKGVPQDYVEAYKWYSN